MNKINIIFLSMFLVFSTNTMAEGNMYNDDCQWCFDDGVCIPCDIGVLPE
ncbi:hypothetical protein [Enterobacter ludwigii]|jgi:hypothetical protein